MMKKTLKYLLIYSLLIFASLQVAAKSSFDQGVPLQVASDRSALVKNLRYDVKFSIPENPTDTVAGCMTATFDYIKEPIESLLFDFKADDNRLNSLKVNGHALKPAIKNEHVVIPKEFLNKGENKVEMKFISSDKGLNRRDGYVYTLFVPDRARCVFPCFDQPDMKASFTLSLQIPEKWKAVGNTYQILEKAIGNGEKEIIFAPTEPLSTYLFAFATGDFFKADYNKNGRKFSAYHRETDPKRVAQLDDIFKDVAASLDWQEDHTAIDYPFAKYDLVILPGFQFGGMEHTGATFYNDKSVFLSENPTPDEYLRRSSLIAHETSHMWFGDLVTMRWFNDVWTKEVFANYYAAQITRELLPDYDHDIEWLRNYTAAAMSEDRSDGRTSIRQNLDNLENAGLIYNNIIYNKAPVMLAKLVDLMGKDAYRDGIREYAKTFSYANADWDELVGILSRHTDENVKEFSRAWVYEKGIPLIFTELDGNSLVVSQSDLLGNGNVWPQRFSVAIYDGENYKPYEVEFKNESRIEIPVEISDYDSSLVLIPNFDGKGYGHFVFEGEQGEKLLNLFMEDNDLPAITRMALMMNLYENYLVGDIDPAAWADACLSRLPFETDPQMATTLVDYMAYPLEQVTIEKRNEIEKRLWDLAQVHPISSCSTAILRMLTNYAYSEEVCELLYNLWEKGESKFLSEKDFMNMAYELAVRFPEKDNEILSNQRSRITNPDRLAEFDYISRASVSDPINRKSLFESLKNPANRRIEPWTGSLLSLLFHPLREEEARDYLYDALMMLPDVQQHGDIFYPANWSKAVLGRLVTKQSLDIVDSVINSEEMKSTLLRNKIQNAAYPLQRLHRK